MRLYLVQHGKCFTKDVDPQKGLSPEGEEEVKTIGKVAKGYAVTVSRILHSGKKRARQTADLFASFLNPKSNVTEIPGINPLDDVIAFWKTTEVTTNLMLVGHLPFMERLASYLITGNPDTRVLKFQNGGIVCLDSESEKDWSIRWMLSPNIS